MKVTKNQVYVLLIGAAAAAWGVDMFVLHGGAPAAAAGASLPTVGAAAPVTAAAPAAAASKGSAGMTLAARMEGAVAGEGRLTDAFTPPAAWLPQEEAVAGSTAASGVEVAKPEKAAFDGAGYRRAHKLTAVLRMGGTGGAAVIDGKMVEIGRRFDGLVLNSVTNTTATLRGEGAEITLVIETGLESSEMQRGGGNRETNVK
jgi:hypothetical protein